MSEFISLYSGSSGNCSVVRTGEKYIIIDMGKGVRTTSAALKELGLNISEDVYKRQAVDGMLDGAACHGKVDHIHSLIVVQHSVDQAAGKGIAAAHAVQNIKGVELALKGVAVVDVYKRQLQGRQHPVAGERAGRQADQFPADQG